MSEINLSADFVKQDIKTEAITEFDLENLSELAGSYEALFSKRAKLYSQRNLKEKQLSEDHYKDLILEHYTFLKRPVIVNANQIFIGSTKQIKEALKESRSKNGWIGES